MPIDFTNLDVQDGKKRVALDGDALATLAMNREFYNGNHWQNRNGWVGPWQLIPERADERTARKVTWLQGELVKGFVSINAIKEGVDRDVAGTVGIEPRWGFAPTEIELPANAEPNSPAAQEATTRAMARAQAAEDVATRWWDRHGGHGHVQDVARRLLYGAGPIAAASGRFYIPAAMLEDVVDSNGVKRKVLRVNSIDDAINVIHFETLDADQGRVIQDPDTLADIGIKPTRRGEEEVLEVTYLAPATNATDQSNISPRRKTVMATIYPTKRPSASFDLAGRLTMRTVTRKALITEQIRQSQRALNFAASMVKRNVETSGFLQDTLLNGELPGHWEGEGDDKKWVLDGIERGPLAFNSFRGIPLHGDPNDPNRETGLTTASIDHREPVDPTPTIKAKQEHYADILGGFNQKHVLISGDATASGESRIQARTDHVAELRLTQTPVEAFGRWMIETAVLLANALVLASTNSDQPNTILDGLRGTFSCFLDAGPVDAADRAQNLAEMKEGALSKTTTIERNGIIDVDAELARINTGPTAGLDAEVKRAEIYAAWIKGGVGEAFAAKRAGLTQQEIDELTKAQTDTPTVTQ
jgi:hypothetical protein